MYSFFFGINLLVPPTGSDGCYNSRLLAAMTPLLGCIAVEQGVMHAPITTGY